MKVNVGGEQGDQEVRPKDQVTRIKEPKTMRYQAKTVKSCVDTKRISQRMHSSALTNDSAKPTANSGASAHCSAARSFQTE